MRGPEEITHRLQYRRVSVHPRNPSLKCPYQTSTSNRIVIPTAGTCCSPRQKLNFSAPCRIRGGAALIALPNVELPILPSTEVAPLNCVWLKTLNASTRKSSDLDSVTARFLATAISKLSAPGP